MRATGRAESQDAREIQGPPQGRQTPESDLCVATLPCTGQSYVTLGSALAVNPKVHLVGQTSGPTPRPDPKVTYYYSWGQDVHNYLLLAPKCHSATRSHLRAGHTVCAERVITFLYVIFV